MLRRGACYWRRAAPHVKPSRGQSCPSLTCKDPNLDFPQRKNVWERTHVVIRFVVAVAAVLSTIGAAAAQYPQKPVKIVVPYAAGGGTDVQARYMVARLSERLGQQFVIENNGGAGGNIATAAAGKAE